MAETTLAEVNKKLSTGIKQVADNTAETNANIRKLVDHFTGLDNLEKDREARNKNKEHNLLKGLLGPSRANERAKSKAKSSGSGLDTFKNFFSGAGVMGLLGPANIGKTLLRLLPGALVVAMADEIVDNLLDGDQLKPKHREMLIRSLEFGGLGLIFGKKFGAIGLAVGALSKELEDPRYDPAMDKMKTALNDLKVALFGETVSVGPGDSYTKGGLLTGSLPWLITNVAEGISGITQIVTGSFLKDDWMEQLKSGNFDKMFDEQFKKDFGEAMAVLGGLALFMAPGGAFRLGLGILRGIVGSPFGKILMAAAAGGAAAKFGWEWLVEAAKDLGIIDAEMSEKLKDQSNNVGTAVTSGIALGGTAKALTPSNPKPPPGTELPDASKQTLRQKAAKLDKEVFDKIRKEVAEEMGLELNKAGQLIDPMSANKGYASKELGTEFAERLNKKLATSVVKKGGIRLTAAAIPFVGWLISLGLTAWDIYEFTQGRGLYYDLYTYLQSNPSAQESLEDLQKRMGLSALQMQTESGRKGGRGATDLMNSLNALRTRDPEAYARMYYKVQSQFTGKGYGKFDQMFKQLEKPSLASDFDYMNYNKPSATEPTVAIGSVQGDTTTVANTQPIIMGDYSTDDKSGGRGMHSTSPFGWGR